MNKQITFNCKAPADMPQGIHIILTSNNKIFKEKSKKTLQHKTKLN